ncbi:MAG: site-specific integrase [Bacteroidetes bacterium]|nr:site-specific integrase [Bacteroidota bacterium]
MLINSLDQEVSAETLKNKLTGKCENKHTLLDAFNYHNEQFKLKVGNDYSNLTYKHYKATLAKIKAFLLHQYKKSDIPLEDLKHIFVTSFEVYLKTHDKCSHNTTMKYIIKLKRVINLAIFNEWINHNPFMNFRCSMKETNRGYLKEISDICGIEKRLTMHLARHTFATTVTLANGVPI